MWKINNSLNDPKRKKRRLALFCSKELSALQVGITFRRANKLRSHGKVCKNKNFCGIIMLSEKDSIFEFNQYMKPDKTPCIIYADMESLIKKQIVQIIQKTFQQQK